MTWFLVSVVFAFMLVEARRAASNERGQRARGGLEPPDDVYRVMQVVYPAAFLAMFAEGFARGPCPFGLVIAGTAIVAAAKALKWWAILSLGRSWTFRVIVVPGSPQVATGPYRWLRHPNYIAVIGELAGVATATCAVVAGPVAIVAFAGLLIKRIAVEERALDMAAR